MLKIFLFVQFERIRWRFLNIRIATFATLLETGGGLTPFCSYFTFFKWLIIIPNPCLSFWFCNFISTLTNLPQYFLILFLSFTAYFKTWTSISFALLLLVFINPSKITNPYFFLFSVSFFPTIINMALFKNLSILTLNNKSSLFKAMIFSLSISFISYYIACLFSKLFTEYVALV